MAGRYRAYTSDQEQQMAAEYKSGLTMREIGDKWFCSWATVSNCLDRAGCAKRPRSTTRRNVNMIMHDWNCGHGVDRIMRVYSFPSTNAVYQWVYRHMRNGQGFVKRKRLTQSEMITAGCIRQGGE